MVENIETELRRVLKEFRPSQMDEQLLTACPFYTPDSREFTSAYRIVHDAVKSMILVRLQMRLNEIAVMSELPLEFGRVDGAAGSRIAVRGGVSEGDGDIILFIEVKTGSVKLVQPAVYTLLHRTKTLVVEMKTGDVLVIDVSKAERIVREFIEHLKNKQMLREVGKRIPGMECRYCGAECEYRNCGGSGKRGGVDPLKSIPAIFDNIGAVVDRIVAEILVELEKRAEAAKVSVNDYMAG